jgi:hypothetical protein
MRSYCCLSASDLFLRRLFNREMVVPKRLEELGLEVTAP